MVHVKAGDPAKPVKILDAYVHSAPSPQHVVDIFEGEWSSMLPPAAGATATPGQVRLFADERIAWLENVVGGFAGKRILELGPLEAGHTWMMHERGAPAIVSVESNSRAFLKCLCVKELLGLDRVRFLHGDALEYLRGREERFDLAVASGVLYHTQEPIELLRRLARVAPAVFLWTHYYDERLLRRLGKRFKEFGKPQEVEIEGRTYVMATRSYGQALQWRGFCGGGSAATLWLTRDSLMRALADVGLRVEAVGFEEPEHENGPALALLARS